MAFALDTPWQRLVCFGIFYICEGIPQGFTETFLPTHFAKVGVSDSAIGRFGFWDAQPWAWKWALAPLVDVFFSRRRWLFWTQALMALTLLLLLAFPDLKGGFAAITAVVFCHNVFSATQDVAIDAIAVGALPLTEGPAADGVMFAAQELGNALGGSTALVVSNSLGYSAGCVFVVGLLGLVFAGFTCRLHPAVGAADVREDGLGQQLLLYLLNLRAALFGPGWWRFWLAVAFACFPSGALLLRGPHCKSRMVADSLGEGEVALVELAGKVASIATMLCGGFLSHKVGARFLVAIAYAGTMLVNGILVLAMSPNLTFRSWMCVKIAFHFIHGFHIGPQMSLFRSCCQENVAATQFTIFCALCNNADSWGKNVLGNWLESSGFHSALSWDAAVVVIPLALLPWVGASLPKGQHAD